MSHKQPFSMRMHRQDQRKSVREVEFASDYEENRDLW
jgi:hypothetical protein